MAQPIPDLWPNSISTSDVRSPASILREQAALLGTKTKNLVVASVRTTTDDGPELDDRGLRRLRRPGDPMTSERFIHSFRFVVPALENYTYTLFRVQHGIEFYPAEFVGPGSMRKNAESEDQFVSVLRAILSMKDTQRVIGSLIAQVETA